IGNGWLGQGWSLPISQEVRRKAGLLVLMDEQGREIEFPYPEAGRQSQLHRYEQLYLSQPQPEEFCISAADESQHWHFSHKVE
ncbi:DUF6531 domain-containing protein, partial [Bacillus wiedmannii]